MVIADFKNRTWEVRCDVTKSPIGEIPMDAPSLGECSRYQKCVELYGPPEGFIAHPFFALFDEESGQWHERDIRLYELQK